MSSNGSTAELSFQGEVAGFVQLDIAVLILTEIAEGDEPKAAARATTALQEMGLKGDSES